MMMVSMYHYPLALPHNTHTSYIDFHFSINSVGTFSPTPVIIKVSVYYLCCWHSSSFPPPIIAVGTLGPSGNHCSNHFYCTQRLFHLR